jgi:hypothetical protein
LNKIGRDMSEFSKTLYSSAFIESSFAESFSDWRTLKACRKEIIVWRAYVSVANDIFVLIYFVNKFTCAYYFLKIGY